MKVGWILKILLFVNSYFCNITCSPDETSSVTSLPFTALLKLFKGNISLKEVAIIYHLISLIYVSFFFLFKYATI